MIKPVVSGIIDNRPGSQTGRDLELGEGSSNSMIRSTNNNEDEQDKHTRESFTNVKDQISAEAERFAEKAIGKDVDVTTINTDAFDGQLIDKIGIAINFVQNFGLAVLIDVNWPPRYEKESNGKGKRTSLNGYFFERRI